MPRPAREEREFVAGLAHGLSVLSAFRSGDQVLTQAQVSAATGLTRATARRSLITLSALGYVETTEKGYRVTPKVVDLAAPWLADPTGWVEVARPFLNQLRDEVNENVSAVILDRTDVVYMIACPADRVISLNARIGARKPAFATAMGRVLLAQMPEQAAACVIAGSDLTRHTHRTETDPNRLMAEVAAARDQGYALIDEELEPGLVAAALPLMNRRGGCTAALNICGHTSQTSIDTLRAKCLPRAQEVAADLAKVLP